MPVCNCNIHIDKPVVTQSSIRILPKRRRRFVNIQFASFREALEYGLLNYKKGFRIFKQNEYDWHDPSNILLAKVENITEVIL